MEIHRIHGLKDSDKGNLFNKSYKFKKNRKIYLKMNNFALIILFIINMYLNCSYN